MCSYLNDENSYKLADVNIIEVVIMSSKDSTKKAPIISVTGLESAGKTTLINRLKTGKFISDSTPTIGFEISIMYNENTRFDVVDLGGQLAFRKSFWQNFVSTSHGCIFVFDRANRNAIATAKEWLWKVEGWLPNNATIAFLANKSDLEEAMPLDEVVDKLELVKFSSKPEHSFQIFETSSLTGENVTECWNWITNSIKRRLQITKEVDIKAFELYDDTLSPIAKIINAPEEEKESLEKAMSVFNDHVAKLVDSVPNMVIENYIIIILRKGDYYGALYIKKDGDVIRGREYGLNILFESISRYHRDLPLDREFLIQVLSTLDYKE